MVDERRQSWWVHHRPDWYSLVAAYKESYEVALTDEDRYRQMSLDAAKTLQAHASLEKTKSRLKAFLHTLVNGQVYDDLCC